VLKMSFWTKAKTWTGTPQFRLRFAWFMGLCWIALAIVGSIRSLERGGLRWRDAANAFIGATWCAGAISLQWAQRHGMSDGDRFKPIELRLNQPPRD
jgi:hypothetical protein